MRHIWGGGEIALPNVSHCISENEVHYNPIHDYSKDYFTIVVSTNNAQIFLSQNGDLDPINLSYSIDNGNTWTTAQQPESWGGTVNLAVLNRGDKIIFKGVNQRLCDPNDDLYRYFIFLELEDYSKAEGVIEGNIMSLLYGDNFRNIKSIDSSRAFGSFFSQVDWITDASNLILPATALTEGCYSYMFYNCTSLTTAPKLPATTLVSNCYYNMFNGCTNLTTAPELPATTLVNGCYSNMFYGCSSLNHIKAMFTTTPNTSYTSQWVSGVASTGTFVKNSSATWDVTGANGIPTGWTVQTASADQTPSEEPK